MSKAAAEYLKQGWAVVPVKRQDKNPQIKDWPTLAAERAFTLEDFRGANVGVVLGPVSKGLVDIDLDSPNAIELAEYFLPPTRTFGRKSKRASHWLYYAKGARSDALPFGPLPKKGTKEKRELVEIRAQNKGDDNCSHQSVFPGSVHESGEKVQWDNDEEIATVDAGELAWSVARLAVASSLLPDWSEGSHRNAKSFGVAGGLLKLGWNGAEVRDCLAAVRECSGYDRPEDAAATERTIEAFEAGKEVTGFGKLVADGELEDHVAKACQRHGRTPATRASEAALAKSRLGRHGLRAELVNEAREVDGMQDAADTIAALDPPKKKKKRAKKQRDEEGNLGALGIEIDLTVEPEPLDYICKGLGLAPGKISAIGGYGGTGKGPLLTLTALCIASGLPLLGHEVKRGRVVYFDFETGRLARIRIARMARALGLDLEQLAKDCWLVFVDASGKRVDEKWLEECEELVELLEPALVCLDSYTSAVPGDQNESTYADQAFALGAISNTHDVTVLVTMHENKGNGGKRADDDLKMLSGTMNLGAALQTQLTIVRPDQNRPNTYELRCGRGPEGKFEPIAIEWKDVEQPETSKGARMRHGGDPNKWGLAVEIVERPAAGLGGVDRSNVMTEIKLRIAKEVVKYLDRADAGGRNIREIRDSVSGGNTEIKNVVAQLVADDVLEESGGLYVVLPPDDDNENNRLRWGLEAPKKKRGRKDIRRE